MYDNLPDTEFFIRWGHVGISSQGFIIRDFYLGGSHGPLMINEDTIWTMMEIQEDARELEIDPIEWLKYCRNEH